jgi:hypothetical protein
VAVVAAAVVVVVVVVVVGEVRLREVVARFTRDDWLRAL